jgi:serine/threonine protein kinase
MSFLREPNSEPIPGYRLIEPLGSGGFGEAWKCEAPGGLFKAIKFVFGNLNSLDVDGARAEQELKALNRVKEVRHPFVLSMDRIEQVNGELIIVMELADRSLHDRFEECVSAGLVGIPRDELLAYVRDAAEALDHMNEKHGLQHLDIKPRNLFLVAGRVKVADFGLVKHLERTGASGLLGGVTPLYAAPETFGGSISDRSDQYSLAIVYQELLTGQRPFNGKNARALAQQHINEEPELRLLPEAERHVVGRALAKDPARRFPNCIAFVRALYTARSGAADGDGESAPRMGGNRPKTMVDTMEDLLLSLPSEGDGPPPFDPGVDGPSSEEVSKLGLTMALPDTGALRPTLVIGVGGLGRRALLELRCRFLDRFGDLDRLPMIRFLYLDSDAEAVKLAVRGSPEVALRPSEVYHLPLQPVGHYRRRQLDALNEWLPREKLYSMPRSLKTQGARALGRLAFTDNYQRAMARLKRELQQATHPDAIYRSVSETGLALRDNVPRVYVLASAGGGSSGCLLDLGYALRRLLRQMRHVEAPVVSLLICGAPDDPTTPAAEQANVYATLTEINHFSDPSIPFSAQYGADGPRLVDEEAPFDNTYMLTMPHRSPEGRRDAMAHLGSYLFHELTTPLGLRLDRIRLKKGGDETLPFRSFGTYGVWFPRGLVLRLAARQACRQMLDEWQIEGEATAQAELEAATARVLADPELHTDTLTARLAEMAGEHMEAPPREALARMLGTLEEQSLQTLAQDDPAAWANQASHRVKDWLGGGVQPPGASSITHRKSRLTRALEQAAQQLADEWDRRFAATAHALMEHPGRRVAVAEEAVQRLLSYLGEVITAQKTRLEAQAGPTSRAQEQLQGALDNCIAGAGGFSWFGNRTRRLLRVFLDHLAAMARQCLTEDLSAATLLFYHALHGRLSDRLSDLASCRQRLRHMGQALEFEQDCVEDLDLALTKDMTPSPTPLVSTESFWEAIRNSATARVVLPDGEERLERAALRFLNTLREEHWTQLDQSLQDHVLGPRGGLFQASGAPDLIRHLAVPLLNQATISLSDHLPVTDVAQVECSLGDESDVEDRIRLYHDQAAPLVTATVGVSSGQVPRVNGDVSRPVVKQRDFLLIPASEAGKAFGEQARDLLPELNLVNVPGQADLMFCREQDALTLDDLDRVLRACRAPYEELVTTPVTTPHARIDIQDWTPLDP